MKLWLTILIHTIVYGAIGLMQGAGEYWPWAIPIAATFIWMSVVDWMTFELPDGAQIVLVVTAASFLYVEIPWDWKEHLAGFIAWPLLTWLVAEVFFRLRGLEGLGFGDVKLMAGIGLLVGFGGGIWVMGTAAVSAASTLLLLSTIRGRSRSSLRETPIAFGPFLSLSAWIIWLWSI